MTTPVTLFKNRNGNCNAALKSGVTVAFVNGRFFTTKANLQAELQAAVDNDNEYGIWIDPSEPTIDPEYATPMDQLRKKHRDELLAELKAGGKLVDAGVSDQTLTQQGLATSVVVPGQGGASDELVALAEEQKKAIEEGTFQPPATEGTRTPQQKLLDKLKAGKA